ncbi:hypothetical protein PR048_031509 [Dryococelus australis]|uniref:Uncharacterized protein n=1 Tax=Dryococelus australis TaxID=614101 RepID=A0ABQ9G9I7_9NEOP|nr:hypothetical protein PR048_031509 [Dryococelus australis]
MIMTREREELTNIQFFESEDTDHFLAKIHVALKQQLDILSQPAYKRVDAPEEFSIACVPASVWMFLLLLLDDPDEHDYEDKQESSKKSRILSIAQDLVFSVSGGKKHSKTRRSLCNFAPGYTIKVTCGFVSSCWTYY